MSFYRQVLNLLCDGRWHDEAELRSLVRYPEDWVRELRLSGREVQEDLRQGHRLYRLAT
jgi:hypothetical protein